MRPEQFPASIEAYYNLVNFSMPFRIWWMQNSTDKINNIVIPFLKTKIV